MPEEKVASAGEQPTPKKKGLQELKKEKLAALNIKPGVPVIKTVYSFAELNAIKDEETKFLIPELIPAHSVAMFIGEDGIGKTQLCTQLCLHVALELPTVFGLKLNAVHFSALICATEDSRKKWIKAAAKQAYNIEPGLKPDKLQLDFMEASTFDEFEELKTNLEEDLKKRPRDLIIIDAFSDLFTLIDGEINSNKDARKLLSFLQHLCNTYLTTMIVIHHAAKTKIVAKRKEGKIFVEKSDAQGAGAITQKPRTVLALSHDPKSASEDGKFYTNYLHVVKANEMGKFYEKNAIQLTFQGETLLHKSQGVVEIELLQEQGGVGVPAEGPFNQKKAAPKEIPLQQHEEVVRISFSETNDLSRAELVKKLCIGYNVGQTKIEQADGFLNHLLNLGLIQKSQRGFRITPPPAPEQTSLPLINESEEDVEGF